MPGSPTVASFRTIIEPFRIHSVEPIAMTTREERAAAHYSDSRSIAS